MNVLSIFEQRIGAIFGDTSDGNATEPFSFKKLAKRAVREMEDETFVIEGVDTAPALYTVLVSASDDQTMRTLYPQITNEISALVEAQAKKRGYTFVGRPLVRFMVDPGLKPGKFAVFAENVDPKTLARLRDEENAFLGRNPQPGAAARPQQESVAPAAATPQPEPASAQGNTGMDGLDIIPDEVMEDIAEENYEKDQVPQPAQPAPSTPQPAAASAAVTCTLTDLQSGRVYTATAPRTAIGRERVPGGIVLRDPNVSRHHAQLVFENGEWVIHDLNSTNGTLVNDIDIEECSLRDGDIITIGLINLQFKGN